MINKIKTLRETIEGIIITDQPALEAFHQQFLGKKGIIAALFNTFKGLSIAEKKVVGIALNDLKTIAENKAKQSKKELNLEVLPTVAHQTDVTLPSFGPEIGSLHPLRIVQNKIIASFRKIGFNLIEGPEIVEDWYNFGALNFPENHPAREMQDTFFVQRNPDRLLRSHTTTVQISTCESTPPPIRSIAVGRVFRNESISARSHCFFHQVDGMYINQDVSFRDLKQVLYYFLQDLFGSTTAIRFRASYFPFTEPSAEVDVTCQLCAGKGCTICKQSGWVEVLGAGMIHPNVLTNCHIDPELYSGFAFGLGIERIAMLLYQINDIRLFSENHMIFLSQFAAEG
ncbi:MAG: phenylalanine--tRNA ligase subunit alpha [Amoebophilaceae bacterium]|nr:phenylalanine--tRNA ligase subunit alpha [Amoebophilaceae bacterium]